MAVFAIILAGWGVTEIIVGAMGWSSSGWAYAVGAALITGGWFALRTLRRVTWADDAGLRLRGMFGTRVIPWSRVRYIRARVDGRRWAVEAGLADGTVILPGTDGTPDRARQSAAGISAVIPGEQWLALGLDLVAAPAAKAGSHTPLLVTDPLRYRAS